MWMMLVTSSYCIMGPLLLIVFTLFVGAVRGAATEQSSDKVNVRIGDRNYPVVFGSSSETPVISTFPADSAGQCVAGCASGGKTDDNNYCQTVTYHFQWTTGTCSIGNIPSSADTTVRPAESGAGAAPDWITIDAKSEPALAPPQSSHKPPPPEKWYHSSGNVNRLGDIDVMFERYVRLTTTTTNTMKGIDKCFKACKKRLVTCVGFNYNWVDRDCYLVNSLKYTFAGDWEIDPKMIFVKIR